MNLALRMEQRQGQNPGVGFIRASSVVRFHYTFRHLALEMFI